jgi:hypothetical protein
MTKKEKKRLDVMKSHQVFLRHILDEIKFERREK